MESPQPGSLLIATVDISDGIFDRSIVLLLDADESGALGVILNKVSDVDLEEVLPRWQNLCSRPQVLFDGGPVSRNGAVCLASPAEQSDEPPGWRALFGDVGLLHLDTPIELVDGAFKDLRIFAGYAGWEPGQLEAELLRGSWYVAAAHHSDAFDPDPETLWRRVLHRQLGDVAVYATWPDDPEQN
ncbi:YqgE/AlgH family protein [Propionicicella superfundia]|uniref:YqgE/AlgH family protein n=1 Tax=Propionicicella superfundia TaxID=348582 RepID=UPI00040142AC|nr:YqgE/AlgH family protein [Propionicicella superfundia]